LEQSLIEQCCRDWVLEKGTRDSTPTNGTLLLLFWKERRGRKMEMGGVLVGGEGRRRGEEKDLGHLLVPGGPAKQLQQVKDGVWDIKHKDVRQQWEVTSLANGGCTNNNK
jgi:hypothetical protein